LQYLRASYEQGLELLRGLMDTDGCISPIGQCEYTTIKEPLARGVLELLYTLGYKASMTVGRAMLYGRDCGPKYRIQFWPLIEQSPFHLERKTARVKNSRTNRSRAGFRYVASVEPTASVPVRCVEVDSPSHLYLAGREMIPTHNSSLAQMLASECHLDMYVLNLAERYMTDQGLQRAVGEMQKNALLLLEDADAAGITREPTAEGTTGVTFSGVLNALDGITASEGRVVVLTTNHPEKLDPALIRPGRVDMVLDLPNATGVQAGALYERILGHPGRAFGARIPDGVYSMAQLQEHLIRFRHDPEAAVDAPLER